MHTWWRGTHLGAFGPMGGLSDFKANGGTILGSASPTDRLDAPTKQQSPEDHAGGSNGTQRLRKLTGGPQGWFAHV